jgi:hypothetical protein
MMSRASPMQNTIRGTRKWLSVTVAFVFEEFFIGKASEPASGLELNEHHDRGAKWDL